MLVYFFLFAVGSSLTTTPEQFGAVGDGTTNDWEPIQKAVASCTGHSTCRVVFAKRYLSGNIVVNSSGVTLDVQGELMMLPKKEYPSFGGGFISNSQGDPSSCKQVHGIKVCLSDVTITGGGVIATTSAWEWWLCKVTGCGRPHLVTFSNVLGVKIFDINFRHSANHNIEVNDCVNVRVDNINIQAPLYSPNTDGINFYGGFDQVLSNSYISSGDDCVSVVNVGENNPECVGHPEKQCCRGGNVVVRNVSCHGGHGISIGGMRHGTVSNVTFQNMTATGGSGNTQGVYSTGGLRIKSYPNGTGSVYDIVYKDIVLEGVYLPLQLLSRYCPWPSKCPPDTTGVHFSRITFVNIRGSGRRGIVGNFNCTAVAPCTNIVLSNVQLTGPNLEPGNLHCAFANLSISDSTPGSCESS
mmetsp:Transcript_4097/g.7914  ORF Transcript_4097/g.7914 Transcript_4097/m.7914 type:complete len:412 (+) Transcript_4097:67-1302(+)|eukprot:CAMPEP_0175138480 /NCGR_PEP_ID=MMETSP0087-20121206/10377_1 /TAXON_ID=136419 /ORGANISM="Unknown Unknown, Strain D1" /LENGTH=411 /DNA_ID=CAMNT_0016421397 /DNA_START=62 /DNA_END=1297 /DNA_ORIENTATION=-